MFGSHEGDAGRAAGCCDAEADEVSAQCFDGEYVQIAPIQSPPERAGTFQACND